MITLGYIFGVIVILSSILMLFPKTALIGSIFVLFSSLLSISGFGGLIIGLILGVIGGVWGIRKIRQKNQEPLEQYNNLNTYKPKY